jgi:tryptophan-rich sensory protein
MISLAAFFIIVFAAAFAGSRFHPDAWYARLAKPAWNPPNWLFAPVWSVLYVLIAVAGWLVWRKTEDFAHPALVFWVAQLLLNLAWTFLFFRRHSPALALLDIGVLLAVIVGFIFTAMSASPLGALLFAPYAIWVAFALFLNLALWSMNRPATA